MSLGQGGREREREREREQALNINDIRGVVFHGLECQKHACNAVALWIKDFIESAA